MTALPRVRLGATILVAVASWWLVLPHVVAAQDTIPLLTTLLRRAATVADGQTRAGTVYVVLERRFPHNVTGVFTIRSAAAAVAGMADRERVLLALAAQGGRLPASPELPVPYVFEIPDWVSGGGCQHNPNTSQMKDDWTQVEPVMQALGQELPTPEPGAPALRAGREGICGQGAMRKRDIDALIITTRFRNGRSVTSTFAPDSIDAIFFTLPALDNFAFPYYQRLFGVSFAAQMRAEIVGNMRTAPTVTRGP